MTTIKQTKPDVVVEKYFSLQLINPSKKITNETLQSVTDSFKNELDTTVADVIIQPIIPIIKECKKCRYSK